MIKLSSETINWFYEKWERKSTLVILIIIITLFFSFKFISNDINDLSIYELIIIILFDIFIYLLWLQSTGIPKAKKGTIGFAIAIFCETKDQKEHIASDFISTIRNLINAQNHIFKFSLIEISEFHSRQIKNFEDVTLLRKKARCHYIIYGSAKLREINGKQNHILNLEAQIAHKPMPDQLSKNFSKEMQEVFPRRLSIDTKNDLITFEFTSEWIESVSKYIIGIASCLSGDDIYAESLFISILKNQRLKDCDLPPIKKIRQRTPIRLGEIYAFRAIKKYERWRKSRTPDALKEVLGQLTKLRKIYPSNYTGRLLAAICHFVFNRDITKAMRELKKCRNINDGTWAYSYAFLFAYQGEMKKARRIYKTAFAYSCNPEVYLQTEEFILWVLEQEPDKIQLYFCLGLINQHGKIDKIQAIKDFKTFLDKRSEAGKTFLIEEQLAKRYIKNIEKNLV